MRELVTNFVWALTGEPQNMLVEDARVVWRHGVARSDATPTADRITDLRGGFLVPGFVDAHCHILPSGLMLQALDLGQCVTREDVLDALADRHAALAPGEWLNAVQYDQNKFVDGRHIDRDELDSISTDRHILLSHVSGHAAVANSAALRAAKVDVDAMKTDGGDYVRDSAGRLTGVLLEAAADHVGGAAPIPTVEQMVDAVLAAGDTMASRGITCAADMMAGYADLERELTAYRLAAERGCRIRLRLYVGWSRVLGPRAMPRERFGEHMQAMDGSTCRVAGLKVFADGALSSRTAAIYGAYEGEVPVARATSRASGPIDREPMPPAQDTSHGGVWSGSLIYNPGRLGEMLRVADEAGFQTATHSLGDYATDCVLAALGSLPQPSRHRLEHVMMLGDAQIERIARLGLPCSLQPEFLLRLKPAYLRSIGPRRTASLERFRSLLDAGVAVGLSSDKPVVAGDPWDGILTAASRPDGFDLRENVSRKEALSGYTAAAADLCGDGGALGRLAPGEWADYQVYEDDPLLAARSVPVEVHLAEE